jgi:hypothetical protein
MPRRALRGCWNFRPRAPPKYWVARVWLSRLYRLQAPARYRLSRRGYPRPATCVASRDPFYCPQSVQLISDHGKFYCRAVPARAQNHYCAWSAPKPRRCREGWEWPPPWAAAATGAHTPVMLDSALAAIGSARARARAARFMPRRDAWPWVRAGAAVSGAASRAPPRSPRSPCRAASAPRPRDRGRARGWNRNQ